MEVQFRQPSPRVTPWHCLVRVKSLCAGVDRRLRRHAGGGGLCEETAFRV